MATLRAIHNNILFQFEEGQARRQNMAHFQEATEWGFEFTDTTESMERGRWVRVMSVGPTCNKEIQPGMRVCVENGKWTTGLKFEGEEYWRTDDEQILLIDESVPTD